MSEPADIIDIVETPPEPIVEQIYSDAIYDACDTPVSHDANPATMGAIVETERKIFTQIKLLLTQIKGLRDDELKEMLDKFVSIYRNSFERCVFLPEPEGCEEVDPHAALRHHLSLRLDQWNEWFADKGVDRTLGRRFKDPNSKNKARMEGDEAIGLEEMKRRIQQIEQERLYEAELQKYQADQEKLDPHLVVVTSNAEAKRLEKEKKSEARRCARAERAKEKKRQKDVEFLKTVTLECAVGYVDASTLEIYKAKCHLCEDRLTDPKYMIIHEKIKHPMMFFCHYDVEFLKTVTLECAVGYVDASTLEIYKAKCHLCEDRLTDPKYMIIHEKIKHPMMFFCHYCDRTFAAHGPMRVHCETVHLGLPIDPPGRRPPERANCTKGLSAPSQQPAPSEQEKLNRNAAHEDAYSDTVNQVAVDELDEVELNKAQPEPVPPDPAPKLPVQRSRSAQAKLPRRGRGNTKKKGMVVSTTAMPVLDAEDKYELASIADVEKSASSEATFKKRPVAVVAPMTKHDSLEDDGQRPGPSGLSRRARGGNRSRAISSQSVVTEHQGVVPLPRGETRTSSPILVQPVPGRTARRMRIYEEKGVYKLSEMESDEDEVQAKERPVRKIADETTKSGRKARYASEQNCSWDNEEKQYAMRMSNVKLEEEVERSYSRKNLAHRTCSLPPYNMVACAESSVRLKRWLSESDVSMPMTASGIMTGIDEVLRRFGLNSSSSSSSCSDSSLLSDSDLDVSSSTSSDTDSDMGYNERLVKFIVSQPGTAKAMAAFLEKEKLRAKKRETTYAEELLLKMFPSNPRVNTLTASHLKGVGAHRDSAPLDVADATKHGAHSVNPPSSTKPTMASTSLPATKQSEYRATAVPSKAKMASPRPMLLKGKARATELLAKMKAAALARQQQMPGDGSNQSSSASDEEEPHVGDSIRGALPEKKGSRRASELLARMKKAAEARAAESPSSSGEESENEVNMGRIRSKLPEVKGASRATELLARMKAAAQARAAQELCDSSDYDANVQVRAKARTGKRVASSKAKSARKMNTNERKGRCSAMKRTHPPSGDDAYGKSGILPVSAPPAKRNRGRPRKTSTLS
ncbi:hypothetical protein Tcan_13626 [Toxocara canis]|uniref:C2H2-type domain-containing protein n=1 Tax=Toxocara canis TaxID=6265 RepID=A0A0B2VQD9_TOXCA|nr:hypothetical protein Tcan_13626 [Toxocara canis]